MLRLWRALPKPLRRINVRIALSLAIIATLGCSAHPTQQQTQFSLPVGVTEDRHPAAKREDILDSFSGEYEDAALSEYVNRVGKRVVGATSAKGTAHTFTVLNSPIINAFSDGSADVYVTRGLLALANNEAQLAAILAHELGHLNAGHRPPDENEAAGPQETGGTIAPGALAGDTVMRNMQVSALAFLHPYSVAQEREADVLAARYLAGAGYDPAEMLAMVRKLQQWSGLEAELDGRTLSSTGPFDYLTTHPDEEYQVQQAIEAADLNVISNPTVGQDAYFAAIDGMLFGEPREEGFILGRTYVHPLLRIRFSVPPGFELFDTPDSVYASGPKDSLVVFDLAQQVGQHSITDYVADVWARDVSVANVDPLTIKGLEAATMTSQVEGSAGAMNLRLVAIRGNSGRVYRFRFLSTQAAAASMAAAYGTTVQSFETIDESEAAAIKPLHVRIVKVMPGDTAQSLARRMPVDQFELQRFRILNGVSSGEAILPGSSVKLLLE